MILTDTVGEGLGTDKNIEVEETANNLEDAVENM